VPEEMLSRLTAVENRLAARQQPEVSSVPADLGSHGDTSLKDKVCTQWHSKQSGHTLRVLLPFHLFFHLFRII